MTPGQKLILMNHSEKLLLALQASTSALRAFALGHHTPEAEALAGQVVAYCDLLIDDLTPKAPVPYPAEPLQPRLSAGIRRIK